MNPFIDIHFNREERFFTGSVFPGIVCRENFKHFHLLLELLNKIDNRVPVNLEITWTKEKKTIIFYSEYNLKKSGHKHKKLGDPEIQGDTPDILFLIESSGTRYLFALEAKMYVHCSGVDLNDQMLRQKPNLIEIATTAGVSSENIFHFGLVPEPMAKSFSSDFRSKVVTWEMLYNQFSTVVQDDYFGDVLKYSTVNYYDLCGQQLVNSEGKLPGEVIYNEYIKRGVKRVGRKNGVRGFINDISSGLWKNQVYEYGLDEVLPNRNWFNIDDFINSVETDLIVKRGRSN
jgi:hypothetical protein